jgi:hypothetical protein
LAEALYKSVWTSAVLGPADFAAAPCKAPSRMALGMKSQAWAALCWRSSERGVIAAE